MLFKNKVNKASDLNTIFFLTYIERSYGYLLFDNKAVSIERLAP